MPLILVGRVEDVEYRTFEKRNGEPGEAYDAYISTGRMTYKTTGREDDGLEPDQRVALTVEPKSWKNTDDVSFDRLSVLTPEQVAKVLARVEG